VAPARGQFPLTVKLFKLIVGTAVMLALWSLLMTTSSPAAGAPSGLQLPAVAHEPPAVGTHVFVAALAVRAPPSRATVKQYQQRQLQGYALRLREGLFSLHNGLFLLHVNGLFCIHIRISLNL
jgi:hypothetical protein